MTTLDKIIKKTIDIALRYPNLTVSDIEKCWEGWREIEEHQSRIGFYNELKNIANKLHQDYDETDYKEEIHELNQKIDEFYKKVKNTLNIDFSSEMQFKLYGCCRDINDVKNYTDEELSLLVRGIAIGEVYWRKGASNGGGSVTGTFATAYALEFRNRRLAEETKKWVDKFGYENNMYGVYKWNGGKENYIKQTKNNKD